METNAISINTTLIKYFKNSILYHIYVIKLYIYKAFY
jgi:hypothetical protein